MESRDSATANETGCITGGGGCVGDRVDLVEFYRVSVDLIAWDAEQRFLSIYQSWGVKSIERRMR